MNEDRIAGTVKEAGGKAQSAIGSAIGDNEMDARGVLNQARGAVQDGYGKVKDKVGNLIEGAPDVAREAVDTGRDYYRRGSSALAGTLGDNAAIALLAAGVVGAAIGWLVFGRDGASGDAAPKPATRATRSTKAKR